MKHCIQDADIYNFEETGFIIHIISIAMVVIRRDGRTKEKRFQVINSQDWAGPPFIIVAGKPSRVLGSKQRVSA